jgi:internalin A
MIPSVIGRMTNIERLFIDYNDALLGIGDGIGNARKLRSIFATSSSISFLPESIGQCTNLSYLDLSYNKLTMLPTSIGNLINLGILYLEGNELESLPSSISNCINLYWVYLANNKLNSLANIDFSGMVHLHEFLCQRNEIAYISPTLTTLDSAYRFDVRGNRLCSVDSSMAQWLSVRTGALNLRVTLT